MRVGKRARRSETREVTAKRTLAVGRVAYSGDTVQCTHRPRPTSERRGNRSSGPPFAIGLARPGRGVYDFSYERARARAHTVPSTRAYVRCACAKPPGNTRVVYVIVTVPFSRRRIVRKQRSYVSRRRNESIGRYRFRIVSTSKRKNNTRNWCVRATQ